MKQQISASSAVVKNEPGLGFPEVAPVVKSEPMFNPMMQGPTANDSGFMDQSQEEVKPQLVAPLQPHQTTQIKTEAGLDVSSSSAAMATSTPVKMASDAVVLANGKHQCTVCSKSFASKQGALKHANTQHKLAL